MKKRKGMKISVWFVNRTPITNETAARVACKLAGIRFMKIKPKTRFQSIPMGIFLTKDRAIADSERFLALSK